MCQHAVDDDDDDDVRCCCLLLAAACCLLSAVCCLLSPAVCCLLLPATGCRPSSTSTSSSSSLPSLPHSHINKSTCRRRHYFQQRARLTPPRVLGGCFGCGAAVQDVISEQGFIHMCFIETLGIGVPVKKHCPTKSQCSCMCSVSCSCRCCCECRWL